MKSNIFLEVKNSNLNAASTGSIIKLKWIFQFLPSLDVVFNPSSMGKNNPLTGDEFSRVLLEKQNLFNENFEKTFGLKKLGFNQSQIDFAQAAMSNMIGGIGYFYGHSKVRYVFIWLFIYY